MLHLHNRPQRRKLKPREKYLKDIKGFQMAFTTSTTNSVHVLDILARPFVMVWNFLVLLAEAGPLTDKINKLNATSDEELAARGVTRADEIQRLFAGKGFM
jgi:hypothetical protein